MTLAPATTREPTQPRLPVVTAAQVVRRRTSGLLLAVGIPLLCLGYSLRETPLDEVINPSGIPLVGSLLASAFTPNLSPDFLALVIRAAKVTIIYAALGTAGALIIGVLGALILSEAVWGGNPPWPTRVLRAGLRAALVAVRSIHELIWALLLVSVLGLDPLVAVLAIAIPFGAQSAKVFADILDSVPPGPLDALRTCGARPTTALAYGLLPPAVPMMLSYSFYRFECAIRSAVVLGAVGVGGLGQELTTSLSSRAWDEVWTLIWMVLIISAVVDLWSSRLRADLAVVSCSEWSGGSTTGTRERSIWARTTALVAIPGVLLAWWLSGVSFSGLTSERTGRLTLKLFDDLWPPQLPKGGWPALLGATVDTLAMAVLAMVLAVAITLLIGPWAARPRAVSAQEGRPLWREAPRWALWAGARTLLLVLRSIPPTVWGIVALLAFFPGVIPGAIALGLYTAGILARLVAEAWETIPTAPRETLVTAGTPRWLASLAAMVPPSLHHLLTYTIYRFEICVRDTSVVGVVGAAGLGRLFGENLAIFRFPAVTTLLIASFAVSLFAEVTGRQLRRALRA